MSQRRTRRSYSPEYKREAAHLVIDTGRTIAEVARELDISEQTLWKWVTNQKAALQPETQGSLSVDERAELKRLRREVFNLRKDNEFLGKAAAFFAAKPKSVNDTN